MPDSRPGQPHNKGNPQDATLVAQCFTFMSGKGPFTSKYNLMHTEQNQEIHFII